MPPRLIEGLLGILVGPSPAGLAIVGDLREEYGAARGRWPWPVTVGWYGMLVLVVGSRIAVGRVVHEWRAGEMMGSFVQDLRYGVRALLGSPLPTFDVDLCYRRTKDNLQRLAEALQELRPTLRGAPGDLPFRLDAESLALGANFTFNTDCGPTLNSW